MARRERKKARKPNLPIIDIDIIDVTRSGSGFGKDKNGRVVFVPFTAPGDRVKVQLTKEKRKFAEADIIELLTKSESRIEPKCSVFSQCGGCQWQHLPYDTQWLIKSKGVLESLQLAKVDLRISIDEYPAEHVWGYRNRIQLRGRGKALGYYARQSHNLISIERCEVAHPEINKKLEFAREQGSETQGEYKVELTLTQDQQVKCNRDKIHGAEGFRQINDEQNSKLQNWIKANTPENTSVLDLYGGAGNLSLPIASQVDEVHCVDLTVPDNDLPDQQLYFHRSAVLPWLQNRIKKIKNKEVPINEHPWFAIIDPPRNGLGDEAAEVIDSLHQHRVTNVILVGCKPDPWARDVKSFVEKGWKLKKMALFDFFPQTSHIESVVLLSKKERAK